MNKCIQKKIWENEHTRPQTLPSVANNTAATSVKLFIDEIKNKNIELRGKNIVDIGCGKGRNSFYLAQHGLKVYAFDYIEYAIQCAQQQVMKSDLRRLIEFSVASMDQEWKFLDNSFDFAVDCFSSIDIESSEGRQVYKRELFRTLRPGGIALVTVVSTQDEFEAKLMRDNPGKEKNSSLWPNGKFQKNYDENELKQFYSDFTFLDFKKITKKSLKLNKEFIGTTFWILLQKPLHTHKG